MHIYSGPQQTQKGAHLLSVPNSEDHHIGMKNQPDKYHYNYNSSLETLRNKRVLLSVNVGFVTIS